MRQPQASSAAVDMLAAKAAPRQAGDVAAGPGQARDHAWDNRVSRYRKDDRDDCRRLLGGEDCASRCNNDVHLLPLYLWKHLRWDGSISVWRRFFTRVLAGPTPTAEDEMAEYLERHQRDLPPALRIELERRSMSL